MIDYIGLGDFSMYSVKETIIVEGRYDKIKLSGFVDGVVFTTNGFGIFKDKKAQKSIRTFAEKTGIVILTDSDRAGIKIRNFVKQLAAGGRVLHAYVPEIEGKERRKTAPGKEGILGVEGISEEIIINAIKKSGAEVNGNGEAVSPKKQITKTDFYLFGLSGREGSEELRGMVATRLGMPSKISANMLLDAVNRIMTRTELEKMTEDIRAEM